MVVRYTIYALLRVLMGLSSLVIFTFTYPFRHFIQRAVYTAENKDVLGCPDNISEKDMIAKNIEGLELDYKRTNKVIALILYPITKFMWLYLKDDGFDAGGARWIREEMNGDNGQEPIIAGCFYRIGDAAYNYKVTNRLRHFWAVYRYTGVRNSVWNLVDFTTRMPDVATKETKGNTIIMHSSDGRKWFYKTVSLTKTYELVLGWDPGNRRLYVNIMKK